MYENIMLISVAGENFFFGFFVDFLRKFAYFFSEVPGMVGEKYKWARLWHENFWPLWENYGGKNYFR